MNAFPWEVIVLAVVLGINRLAIHAAAKRPALFWGIQLLDAALAVLVLVFGMPGLQHLPGVAWLVAAILVFHLVQNFSIRSRALHDERRKAEEKELLRMAREAAESEARPGSRGDEAEEMGVPRHDPR